MPIASVHEFHSNDPDQVSEFIGRIYADNQFRPQRAARRDVVIGGVEWRGIGVYDVDYKMPFRFHSEMDRPNYLFLTCRRGGATYSAQNGREAQCSLGDVMPISNVGISDCVTQPEGFGHLSVILESAALSEFVTCWLGRPIVEPVIFAMKPLNQVTATQWNAAAECLRQMISMSPMPEFAIRSMYEHMIRLVATGHESNYSALISDRRCATEAEARKAIALIDQDPMRWQTLTILGYAIGCASSALENAILRLAGKSFQMLSLDARMRWVRRALASGDAGSYVGTIRAYGFRPSSRFVSEYCRRFGEYPSATYRRNPHSAGACTGREAAFADPLSVSAIDDFIERRLSGTISLKDVAQHVGLSEFETIAIFKERFSRTPMQYVGERKLEKARWMLHHTSESLASIAIECGFSSQSYLTTQIKRYYGVTPRQLRLSAGAYAV
ncbi:AraC family transcriptional regulator [Pandoraea apista]|uniref:AraC family transcriptional regulator n=1 Tax=Pandoraea apista TaxID=93218 RepID=UPI000F68E4E1|nr:helix-turn-helix domain-containing protein [Pandoraea apista]RRW87884.1 AraC family transcriptional regulator [Pandoraea apista]RRW96274.1 AraC family transcriptional regulator [Pandoraea apista]